MTIARRLTLAGFALLLAAAALLGWSALHQLDALAGEEAQVRAELIAQALAQRVERAAALGIPLGSLQGVERLFADRMEDFDEIATLSLVDSSGRVLATHSRGGADAAANETLAPVVVRNEAVARIVLQRRAPAIFTLAANWAPLLVALVAVFSLLASEALRHALARGPRSRNAVVASACGALRHGDFTRRLPLMRRRDFDLRPQWLSAQLRQAHERHLRIRRLANSLRMTEPDAQRRAELDEALALAVDGDQFAGMETSVMAAPDLSRPHARWWGLVLGLAAWTPALFALLAASRAETWSLAQWGGNALLSALSAAVLAGLFLRRESGTWKQFVPALLGALLFAGPGLFMAAVVLACPQAAWPLELPGTLLSAWVAATCMAWLYATVRRPRNQATATAAESATPAMEQARAA